MRIRKCIRIVLCVVLALCIVGCSNQEQKMKEKYAGVLPISDLMQPIFESKEILNETIFFLDYEEEKSLLFVPDEVKSVTSYDGTIVYQEGVDYEVQDGKIILPIGSSIPCITKEVYYQSEDTDYKIKVEGKGWTNFYHGEKDAMSKYQVCVNYTHSDTWEGYKQKSYADCYEALLQKLKKGKDVTIYFYGDSITEGSNASFCEGVEPGQYPYSLLFVQTLAEIFDYKVSFVNTDNNVKVPDKDLDFGKRGTITYINSAVGGWSVYQGIVNFDTAVKPYMEKYNCDLFVLAFGMNDGGLDPEVEAKGKKEIIDKVLEIVPETSILMVSTMAPHPNSSIDEAQNEQEPCLYALAKEYQKAGVSCALASMNSVSLSVLEHKDFSDISGNNLNHPNDFMSRIYAQTLIQTVVGYDNIWGMLKD